MTFYHEKQPNEAYRLGIDFSGDLGSDGISTATVAVTDGGTDATSLIVDATRQQISGKIVYFWVRNGTSLKTYKVTVSIVSSTSEQYEADLMLSIRDL